jgi:L-amino acid N-acyltransferase YncA
MSFTMTFQSFPQPGGPLRYAYVPWDAEMYGFPFYELGCGDLPPELLDKHLSPWLRSLPVDRACLVYSRIPPRAVAVSRVLTNCGFYPVETTIDIYLPLSRLTPIVSHQSKQLRLRPATEADLPQMITIAGSAFCNDRLHLDPNLPPEKADLRYAHWIETGYRAGEPVFVLEDTRNAQVIGFFHLRETAPNTIDLSLAAIDNDYQKTAAGVLMYQTTLVECQTRGYQMAITRISLNNTNVVNLLMRLGFAVRSAVTTLHWFQPAAREPSHGEKRQSPRL